MISAFSFGHSAFAAGVTVIIVETSNVGVKVGMVGRGVIEEVGVLVTMDVFVGRGEGVSVAETVTTGVIVAAGVHAARRKIMARET